MDSLAYLSVLLIPFIMGIGILGYFGWQFYLDKKKEKAEGQATETNWSRILVTLLFWVVFVGYFVWRAMTDRG